MSTYAAIGAVGLSLQRLLNDRLDKPPGTMVVVTVGNPPNEPDAEIPIVNLFLYRVSLNGALSNLPPGYPPGTTMAPKETDVRINRYVGPHGAFITTPPTCPPSRKWITTVALHYTDGTTDTVSDATPCHRTKERRAPKKRDRRPIPQRP